MEIKDSSSISTDISEFCIPYEIATSNTPSNDVANIDGPGNLVLYSGSNGDLNSTLIISKSTHIRVNATGSNGVNYANLLNYCSTGSIFLSSTEYSNAHAIFNFTSVSEANDYIEFEVIPLVSSSNVPFCPYEDICISIDCAGGGSLEGFDVELLEWKTQSLWSALFTPTSASYPLTNEPVSASNDILIDTNGGNDSGQGFNGTAEFHISNSIVRSTRFDSQISVVSQSNDITNPVATRYVTAHEYNVTTAEDKDLATLVLTRDPYASSGDIKASEFFNSCIVNHIAMTSGSAAGSAKRYQHATHYFTWWNQYNHPDAPYLLNCTTVEYNRYPSNQLIFNPGSVTGSFDSEGRLVVTAYHYIVNNVQHFFEYKYEGKQPYFL